MNKNKNQEKQNQEILVNLRRVWRALRRQLVENDLLINDFKEQATRALKNSEYKGPINDEILNEFVFYK
jgi:succinate dehydrogenase flavin-adding protein (antitoxin of CptAB toxin-antitoxin module)